jgi:hypothetical protein
MRTEGRRRYGFVYQTAAGRAGKSDELSTDSRLLCHCLARAGNTGHAMFDPGELADKLARPNKLTGEIRPLDRKTVREAIGRLVRAGLAAEGSTAQCVVLPWDFWERRFGGTPHCKVHGTRAAFRHGDWDKPPPPDLPGL